MYVCTIEHSHFFVWSETKKPLEVLPVAPAPKARELSVNELEKLREHEENTLRELRIFLREITVKLMSDRKFKEFYKPVDLEEVWHSCLYHHVLASVH